MLICHTYFFDLSYISSLEPYLCILSAGSVSRFLRLIGKSGGKSSAGRSSVSRRFSLSPSTSSRSSVDLLEWRKMVKFCDTDYFIVNKV